MTAQQNNILGSGVVGLGTGFLLSGSGLLMFSKSTDVHKSAITLLIIGASIVVIQRIFLPVREN